MRRLALLALLPLCACIQVVPVTWADPAQDAAAKRFEAPAGRARLYVYRNQRIGGTTPIPVRLNDQSVGDSAPYTYLALDLKPGAYQLSARGEKESVLALRLEAGRTYFVWQEMKAGDDKARCILQSVDAKEGMDGVKECRLVESAGALPEPLPKR